jgi:hypothetical protein
MSHKVQIENIDHRTSEKRLVISYRILQSCNNVIAPRGWEPILLDSAGNFGCGYRNICGEWIYMTPNDQHPEHSPTTLEGKICNSSHVYKYVWDYEGEFGLDPTEFETDHSYLLSLQFDDLSCGWIDPCDDPSRCHQVPPGLGGQVGECAEGEAGTQGNCPNGWVIAIDNSGGELDGCPYCYFDNTGGTGPSGPTGPGTPPWWTIDTRDTIPPTIPTTQETFGTYPTYPTTFDDGDNPDDIDDSIPPGAGGGGGGHVTTPGDDPYRDTPPPGGMGPGAPFVPTGGGIRYSCVRVPTLGISVCVGIPNGQYVTLGLCQAVCAGTIGGDDPACVPSPDGDLLGGLGSSVLLSNECGPPISGQPGGLKVYDHDVPPEPDDSATSVSSHGINQRGYSDSTDEGSNTDGAAGTLKSSNSNSEVIPDDEGNVITAWGGARPSLFIADPNAHPNDSLLRRTAVLPGYIVGAYFSSVKKRSLNPNRIISADAISISPTSSTNDSPNDPRSSAVSANFTPITAYKVGTNYINTSSTGKSVRLIPSRPHHHGARRRGFNPDELSSSGTTNFYKKGTSSDTRPGIGAVFSSQKAISPNVRSNALPDFFTEADASGEWRFPVFTVRVTSGSRNEIFTSIKAEKLTPGDKDLYQLQVWAVSGDKKSKIVLAKSRMKSALFSSKSYKIAKRCSVNLTPGIISIVAIMVDVDGKVKAMKQENLTILHPGTDPHGGLGRQLVKQRRTHSSLLAKLGEGPSITVYLEKATNLLVKLKDSEKRVSKTEVSFSAVAEGAPIGAGKFHHSFRLSQKVGSKYKLITKSSAPYIDSVPLARSNKNSGTLFRGLSSDDNPDTEFGGNILKLSVGAVGSGLGHYTKIYLGRDMEFVKESLTVTYNASTLVASCSVSVPFAKHKIELFLAGRKYGEAVTSTIKEAHTSEYGVISTTISNALLGQWVGIALVNSLPRASRTILWTQVK